MSQGSGYKISRTRGVTGRGGGSIYGLSGPGASALIWVRARQQPARQPLIVALHGKFFFTINTVARTQKIKENKYNNV